jgi:EAL domain-containing protein (putative c-di-GMP-specific phosphodiesterase class I)
MAEFARLGIHVYIDDFGTGQSSLNYLKNLPVPVLKIAKRFVDEIEDNPAELKFLENIIQLVKSRDKQVVVEGVSTPSQREMLREIGCELMQGYFFSKPLPADEFKNLLEKGGVLPL